MKADGSQLDEAAAVLTMARPAEGTPPRTRDEFARQVAAVWADVLEVEEVRPQDNFFELGGDSLRAVRVLLDVEKLHGQDLPATYLYQHPTFEQFIRALTFRVPADPAGSLIVIQQGQSTAPLFWLPGATASTKVLLGHASYIFRLARQLGTDHPVYSVYQEHPAEAAASTMARMAADLLKDIRERQPAGPYYLAGWSFGGLLAYEMARQLEHAGEKVALLALLDTLAPGYPRSRSWRRRAAVIWTQWTSHQPGTKRIHPWTALPRYLLDQAIAVSRKWRAALGRRNPWDRVMRLEAEYLTARHSYGGHVTVFASEATLAATEDLISVVHDPALGWNEVAASVEHHAIPGDHHTMFEEPGLEKIARLLRAHLP